MVEPTPDDYGVGARLSLHPMTDDFVEVILGALDAVDNSDVVVTTDDVSTHVRGTEAALLAWLVDVITHAGRTGVHTVAQVLLSRGCPGEVACGIADGAAHAPALSSDAVPEPTGLQAAAHWSLYPLDDGPGADHMAGITAAIDNARARGVFTRSEHYATRLDGDLSEVMATVLEGWLLVGRDVRHVTTHATISLNSPTAGGAR